MPCHDRRQKSWMLMHADQDWEEYLLPNAFFLIQLLFTVHLILKSVYINLILCMFYI